MNYINSIPISGSIDNSSLNYLYLDLSPAEFEKYTKKYIVCGFGYNSKVYTLWGMFARLDGTLCANSRIYKQYFKQIRNITSKFVGYYDEVVTLGNCYSYYNYGHSFQDFLHPLFIFPQELLARSKIMFGAVPAILEVLQFFNISKDQLISIEPYECIYCNIIHTLTPIAFLDYYADIGLKLKALFFKKFNLGIYSPHLFCFINRPNGTFRHIPNFQEIMNYTAKHYTNVTFVERRDTYSTIKENAVMFAQIKFLFSPTGSNLIKTYFMHNDTVIVSVGTGDFFYKYDNSVIINCITTRIFFLQFRTKLKHSSPGTNISVEQSFKYIQIGLYCAFNGHWPNVTNPI